MTRRQKRLEKIRQNPKNVKFADLRQLLEDYGFELKRTKGSHHTFVGMVGEEKVSLVVPFKKPLNTIYVKKALSIIDQIEHVDDDE